QTIDSPVVEKGGHVGLGVESLEEFPQKVRRFNDGPSPFHRELLLPAIIKGI
ncbi:hypothetical protein HAX54_022786, partial [Datura stramonium]|nr:hypothetical protein [Datura stramonium]